MTGLAATLPLYSARPRIKVNGVQNARLDAGLLSLSVKENEQGLYSCELILGNWGTVNSDLDYLYFDRSIFDFGGSLQIEMGDGNAAAQVFLGKITGIEGRFIESRPPEILILAEDKLQDLRMTRRTRSFEDLSLQDVAESIARDHGLQAEIDIDSPTYKNLSQLNQSDLAFLRERARLVDAEVWVEDQRLYVQTRARRKVAELEVVYKQHLHEFRVCADLAHQRTRFSVSGWDVQAKDKFEVEVDKSVIEAELAGGLSGSQILQQAFGERRDCAVHLAPVSNEETRSLAESCYRTLARQFVTGQGIAEGDARYKAGAKINIQGLGTMFSGAYYINSVHHMFSAERGYKTSFSVERPAIGF